MNITHSFLKPRLVGKRFDDHTIPLEILKDFAVLEEMIIETAKWKYLEKNSERQRVPRGFSNGVSLRLKTIEPGSAVPEFIYEINQESMFPEITDYLEEAKSSVVSAISAAEDDGDITQHMPSNLLAYFDRFGRSLLDDEVIEFTMPNNENEKAKLNRITRKKLLFASKVSEVTDEIMLRGIIPEADQEKMKFEIKLIDGSKVVAPIAIEYMKTVLDAFQGYKENLKVVLRGIGKFNRHEKLISIESIEHISILDPLDVPARIDELRPMKEGWLDGKNGVILEKQDLDWFSEIFEKYFSSDLPLPYVYPVPDGGLLLEWSIAGHDISLEVSFPERKAQWHDYDLILDKEDVKSLDLELRSDWEVFMKQLKTYMDSDNE